MWTTWMEVSSARTRFGKTNSGWFDAFGFYGWSNKVFLPDAKINVRNRSTLSHDCMEFYQSAKNITYNFAVCQLIQHIYFSPSVADGPLKRYWREIWDEWKIMVWCKFQNTNQRGISKIYYLSYLPNCIQNGVNFHWIYKLVLRLDHQYLLKRLRDYQPDQNQTPVQEHVSMAVIEIWNNFAMLICQNRRKRRLISH